MQIKVIYDEPRSMAGLTISEDGSAILSSPFQQAAAAPDPEDETDTLLCGNLFP